MWAPPLWKDVWVGLNLSIFQQEKYHSSYQSIQFQGTRGGREWRNWPIPSDGKSTSIGSTVCHGTATDIPATDGSAL